MRLACRILVIMTRTNIIEIYRKTYCQVNDDVAQLIIFDEDKKFHLGGTYDKQDDLIAPCI